MANPAGEWFAPDGVPIYEIREDLGLEENDHLYRARDRILDRDVLLAMGGDDLLARASFAGRLEHPGAVPIYDIGRDPGGRVFVAAMDYTLARPLSEALGEMSRDEVLRVVVSVAQTVAHAESRGVRHPGLDLDQVLLFPDGQWRVVGWERAQSVEEPPTRTVQKLLRRAIVPYGKAPQALWSIVRHDYRDAGQLARDLAAYLDGASELRATKLTLRQRLAAWGHRRPALATVLAGSGLVLVLSILASGAFYVLHEKEEAQRVELEGQAGAEAIEAALTKASEKIPEVQKLDRWRLKRLKDRQELYHATEQRRPTEEEIELDGELARLSRERTGLAQEIEVALTAAEGDPHALEVRLVLEKGRLEWLFAAAGYEERKTLSTRTLGRARETRAVGEALLAHDIAGAREVLSGVADENPFRLAAEALVETLEVHLDWARQLNTLAAVLVGDGTLAVSGIPQGASISLAPIERDAEERWQIGEENEIVANQVYARPMGNYLVQVVHRGNEFLFEVLLERAELEEIDAREIPDAIPDGFVWIPAATLYVGGDGRNATRYRRARVEAPFLIGLTEVTFREAGVQGEGAEPDGPVGGIAHLQALEFCRRSASPGWTGDLPTEAEWELAARGVAGRDFPWGDRYFAHAANTVDYRENSSRTAAGVPETDRSIFGVQGMAGNVVEWTKSAFAQGTQLVTVKGGYFHHGEQQAMAPARMGASADVSVHTLGFRQVLRR
ncbi:MAG: SUMF1/EgtB/PvdO family nonheme iron enzyme [Planctomycetes bacterium]|nr:SUMF1/EgtB/PvdO family nonheme iron enzyme [Planctomycetota bacterium]